MSKRNLQHRVYPYLLRGLTIDPPNQVWSIDITYIRLHKSWMYLTSVIDWYSRCILGWELDQTLAMDFVLEAVQRAFTVGGGPDIFNSDQGNHFTISLLKEHPSVQISMDSKGRALDNIRIERFWRSLMYEEVYLKDYGTPREARNNIRDYMMHYNHERPHQSLNYKTPGSVYFH